MPYKVTVEPILFLYMLSTFMLYPALQDLIYTKICINQYSISTCKDLHNPSNSEALDEVQRSSSYWILGSTFMLTLPSIFSAQYLGSWSDLYGRKLPLLIPSIGGVFASLVYIGLSVNLNKWPVSLILLSSFFSGISGGFSSCILLSMSYITEITIEQTRTVRISILESMTFIGATLGPLLAGWIKEIAGRNFIFVTIMAFFTIIVFYIIIFLDDIMPRCSSEGSWIKDGLKIKHVTSPVLTILRFRQERRRFYLLMFLLAAAIIFFCTLGEMDISYLYVADDPIDWNIKNYSAYFSLKYGLGSFSLLFILPFFRNLSDSFLITVGIVSKMLGYVVIGLARNSVTVYVSAAISFLNTWSVPVIRSAMTKLVDHGEQGKMFAGIAIVENVCGVAATLIFNSLYPEMRRVFKGFIFIVEAMMLIVPFCITCYLHFALKKMSSYGDLMENLERSMEDQRRLSISSGSTPTVPSPASSSPFDSPEMLAKIVSKTNASPDVGD